MKSSIVKCQVCSYENPGEAKFCMHCGSRLEVEAQPTVDTRLSSLQQSAPKGLMEKIVAAQSQIRGERRPVTILFTDIVGSTAIASEMDPEDWREIVARAHHRVSEAIYRYEGTITQLLGDGVLAFFGAPVAHEDDPVRAVHAALEIQESIQEYSRTISDQVESFQMRAGINTGTVVIGDIGTDMHVEYLAFGDAVNIASRLENAAEPGAVLVSEDTYKLIAHAFETEDLGTIQVKGKDEPLRAFRVIAPRARPRKLRGVEGLDSPLVGREQEYQTLVDALERLQTEEGGIATIVGEAGAGKSRLVAEVRKVASTMDVSWVEGRCLSYGGTVPYLLWLDLLREFLGVKPEDSPEYVKEKLQGRIEELSPDRYETLYPYLGHLLSLSLEEELQEWIRDQDGEQLRSGTFEAIETFIREAVSDRPLALVCEDLHWADPTSIQLLERSFQLADQEKLLVICVYRPEKDHPCWGLKEFTSGHYLDRYKDLQIEPLSTAESRELVANLVGMEGIPEGLKERILNHAEGNPFYVEEILRSLIDSGDLALDEDTNQWVASIDIGEIAIPETLNGVLLSRIDRLHRDTKRVLQMASVIGRIFLYRVLKAIAEEECELDGHLRDLQEEEMIRERIRIPELEYIFKHHLTQEAAYNGLLKSERRTFHRQVAEALEGLFPDRVEENLGLLAYHWERAEDTERATEFLLRAGDQARLAYAHQEAVDYYQRALYIFEGGDNYERAARTLMRLGLTYHTAFDYERSRQAYDEAFSMEQRERTKLSSSQLPSPHPFRRYAWAPRSLDSTTETSGISYFYIRKLFSGLVEIGPGWEIFPDVAKSWQITDGGHKYVFQLRDDVFWSDGARLTAEDFEYACRRILDPGLRSENAELLFDVRNAKKFYQRNISNPEHIGVRAIDPLTLEFALDKPASYFLYLIAKLYPIPRHRVEVYGDTWADIDRIVTYGAFVIESYIPGESMLLIRNPRYRGRFPGNIQKLFVKFRDTLASSSEELEQYEHNEIDFVVLTEDTYEIRHRLGGEYVTEPEYSVGWVGFDYTCPPFDDLKVRQAFIMAVDRERLVEAVFRGLHNPATGGFIPPGIPGYSKGIGLPYDPSYARDLLAQAGYPGGREFPNLEFVWIGQSEMFEYLISEWLRNLHVYARVRIVESKNIQEELRTKRIFYDGWRADYPDPDSFLRVGVHVHFPYWKNDRYNQLVASARRSSKQEERIRLYREADHVLINEAIVMPLLYGREHYLLKPWIRRPVWTTKEIIIEPH